MRIAIDIDDCLTNTCEVDFATCYMWNKKHHPQDKKQYFPNHHNAPTIFGYSKEEDDAFYVYQRKLVIEQDLIKPKIYAKEALQQLLDEGHEIYLVTGRGDMYWGNAYEESEKWLDHYGIKYTALITNCSNKGEFCEKYKCDVLIDDNEKYLKQVNDKNIHSISFWANYNDFYKHPLNHVACCWPEVYDKVKIIEKQLEYTTNDKQEKLYAEK